MTASGGSSASSSEKWLRLCRARWRGGGQGSRGQLAADEGVLGAERRKGGGLLGCRSSFHCCAFTLGRLPFDLICFLAMHSDGIRFALTQDI